MWIADGLSSGIRWRPRPPNVPPSRVGIIRILRDQDPLEVRRDARSRSRGLGRVRSCHQQFDLIVADLQAEAQSQFRVPPADAVGAA